MLMLLLSATEFEIRETIHWLDDKSLQHNAGIPELLITGIGQLRTASAIQKKISIKKPSLVIQAGIGGAPDPEDIGKVYAIGSEYIADLGVMDQQGFHNLFELGLEDPDSFPFQNGALKNPYQRLLELTGLPVREGITVNEIKSEDFAGFQRNARPLVESMEGAALHYVCLMEKIPFVQIRAVSNVMGDRNKSRWKIKESCHNLNESLIGIIQKLENADETFFGI